MRARSAPVATIVGGAPPSAASTQRTSAARATGSVAGVPSARSPTIRPPRRTESALRAPSATTIAASPAASGIRLQTAIGASSTRDAGEPRRTERPQRARRAELAVTDLDREDAHGFPLRRRRLERDRGRQLLRAAMAVVLTDRDLDGARQLVALPDAMPAAAVEAAHAERADSREHGNRGRLRCRNRC